MDSVIDFNRKFAQHIENIFKLDFDNIYEIEFKDVGPIYVGTCKKTNREVVIKSRIKSIMDDSKEAYILWLLRNNPFVVKCLGLYYTDGTTYTVLEYIEGTILYDCLEDDSIDHIMSKCREALNSIHSMNIVHGDVMETNIMVTNTGEIRFIDFEDATVNPTQKQINNDLKNLMIITKEYHSNSHWEKYRSRKSSS